MIRTIATILATTILGFVVSLCGLLITIVVWRPRRYASWGAKLWANGIMYAAGVRVTIDGLDRLPLGQAVFLVGNHQSAMDIPILLQAFRGEVRFMAKKSLFWVPIWGWWLYAAGFVPINRSNARAAHRSLERMLASLRRDPISFVVFPEGTRSTDGRLLPFRKGAMKICRRSGLSVVPFSMNGSLAVLARGHYRVRAGTVRLRLSAPIPAEEVAAMSSDELHDRVREAVANGLHSNE